MRSGSTSIGSDGFISIDERHRSDFKSLPAKTLDEWLAWQSTLHPEAIVLGLDRVRQVAGSMGLETRAASIEQGQDDGAAGAKAKTQAALPIRIVIAGTNGKGSCAAFLDAMLGAAGLRTGVYTSPHLFRYNERVRIAGEAVGDADLTEAFERVDAARLEVPLTFFEFGTLAAADLIERSQVDIAILEVGLGGRLDAVNLFDSSIALITSIDLDHCEWLGDDRESIGWEKAGILRPRTPCIIGERDPPHSVLERAFAIEAPCSVLGSDFAPQFPKGSRQGKAGGYWHWRDVAGDCIADLPPPGLSGRHQLDNAAACVALFCRLAPILSIDRAAIEEAIRQGIARASILGRQQIIDIPASTKAGDRKTSMRDASACGALTTGLVAIESADTKAPDLGSPGEGVVRLMVDVAHNPSGAKALADRLAAQATRDEIEASKEGISSPLAEGTGGRPVRRAVCGILADKDAGAMLRSLAPEIDRWYAATLDGARGRCGSSLLEALPQGALGRAFDCVEAAFEAALSESEKDDEIVAFGSFVTVERVLRLAAPDFCREI
ncbi:bifunctional folylpolyglutamate synthase/dihydrofolate synthase [Thioalkalivibrio sp. HK1]|uniref:bifunctional folylpolyglutamate synthase/dihydrofolate synthase n=1 Tax=Thioalkalivibrio sp. HK1 TaxID=1469245 RepID=UPI0004B0342D|nr:folylpolyglutamate synthase/dihydrofolate synthase family protein [Thioalkalivibrio sp. HK1]